MGDRRDRANGPSIGTGRHAVNAAYTPHASRDLCRPLASCFLSKLVVCHVVCWLYVACMPSCMLAVSMLYDGCSLYAMLYAVCSLCAMLYAGCIYVV